MEKVKLLKPIHEKHVSKNFTDFGIHIERANLSNYFGNDPKNSRLYIDYNLFDEEDDKY